MLWCAVALGDAGVVVPPGWNAPSGQQHNMSVYVRVEDVDGRRVESPGSVLAVFDAAGTCRGTMEIGNGPNDSRLFWGLVSSDSATEKGLTAKVLDSASGEALELTAAVEFTADAVLGSLSEPLVWRVRPATAALAIPLVQNWNWVSFNVAQGDRTIGEFLADYAQYATDGDLIKSQNGQATYSGGKWYASPSTFRLEPGRMYKLRKQKAGECTLNVEGTPVAPETAIAVVKGWNWLGYTGESIAAISAIFKEGGFSDNDLLKGQTGGQATYSGGKWYGSVTLKPGAGYMLKLAAPGSVDFRYAKENSR